MDEVRVRRKRGTAHARSAASVKQALRHGIDVIYHASYTDEESLDMLEAAKDRGLRRAGHRDPLRDAARGRGLRASRTRRRSAMGYQHEWDARDRVAARDAPARRARAARRRLRLRVHRRTARTRATSSSSSSTSA
jgi:imidazolonepropionase-like amidohydrolase